MLYQEIKRIMHMLVSLLVTVGRNTLSASELSVAKIRADECVFLHSPPPVLGVPGVQFCFAIVTKEWYLQTFLITYYQLRISYFRIKEEEDISICDARMVIEVERSFVEGTFSPTFDVEEFGEEVD